MDSSGRIHMYDDRAPTAAPSADRFHHTGFVTREPMPEKCDPRRVLTALDKIAEGWRDSEPVPESAAALVPLTPFERGYVLGVLAEFRSWRASH